MIWLKFCSLLSLAMLVFAEDKPCTVDADGQFFDLNPLTASKDYTFKSPSGREFVLNVCKPIATEIWNPKVENPDNIGGFAMGAHGHISLGNVNTTILIRDRSPVLMMQDGSPCPQTSDMKASSAIRFVCDPHSGTGQPQYVAQLPPSDDIACAFVFEWRTQYACPASRGFFGFIGGIFHFIWMSVLSIVVLVVLFFGIRFLYRKFILKQDDQFPAFSERPSSAFSSALSEVSYFFRDLFNRLTHRDPWSGSSGRSWGWSRVQWSSWRSRSNSDYMGRGDRSGYDRVPASREEAQSIIGADGRFSSDDEDDHAANEPSAPSRPSGMDTEGVIRL